ncbi:MAG: P1 family peptidase, partial [Chloroflexi bacterium]|nr:P1 family peptidase [Chloroflexota bacterium]
SIAHDGIALAVRPAHLMGDGDTLFALSTGAHVGEFQIDQVLAAGVQCVAWAIVRGVEKARGIGGVPGVMELSK